MTDKVKNIIIVCLCSVLFFGVFAFQLFTPDKDTSSSERRVLAKFTKPTAETVINGRFMEGFEDYSMDQFPLRDKLRTVKALSSKYMLMQKDKSGLYQVNGHISKLEYPLDVNSIDNAANKFHFIYDKYIDGSGNKAYLSIIPDKNSFMAKANGYPSMDYKALSDELKTRTDFAEYIDITDCLELSDYYFTDTHWRQEKIVDVAQRLADAMDTSVSTDYDVTKLDNDFYGVYYGQAALPIKAEELYYLENNAIRNMTVFDYESNKSIGIYDMTLAYDKDPYEMFLSGSKALLKITNHECDNGRRLIVFRDSFGSSIAPLLATGYSEVVLVDIRYISSELIGNMIDFNDADVLFLYSTIVLNNSITFK